MGHSPVTGRRSKGTGRGPEWMITELGIFDFDDTGHARLCAIYPDVDVATVAAATGFPLRVADPVEVIAPPTEAEIALVRRFDPLGVRRSEFGPKELGRTFSFAAFATS